MAMSDASKRVLNYLKENNGEDMTLHSISADLDMAVRSVNGCLVGMQKKNLIVREPFETKDEAGKTVTIKYIRLTEEGAGFNPDAE